MESGTSGSIQSSSGGDEEYDSRSERMPRPPFFFNAPSSHSPHLPIGSPHHHQPPVPPPASSTLFDPFTNYLDTFSRQSPPGPAISNLDMMWARSAAPGPSLPSTTIPLNIASSSSSPAASSGIGGSGSSLPVPTGPPPKNPKKRSRASRRAPTTILATDTTNFRAMVQEFTGIPAPPFAQGPPFSRSRLDLFGTPSSSPSPYLLRPYAQKIHPSFYPSSSVVLDHLLPSSSTSTTAPINFMASNMPDLRSATISSSTSSNAYRILSPPTNNINIFTQQQNTTLNDNQQLFTFQSLLQPLPPSPPKYPSVDYMFVPGLERQQPGRGTGDSALKIAGMSLLHVNDHMPGDQVRSGSTSTRPPLRKDDGGGNNWLETIVLGGDGGCTYNGSGSSRTNFSASSSDFNTEKSPDQNHAPSTSRSEGIVDSWICSSDQ